MEPSKLSLNNALMQQSYLKGYYGYQNFGDEVLFFGVIDWIFTHHGIHHITVDVGDKHRMQDWVHKTAPLVRGEKASNYIKHITFYQPKDTKRSYWIHIKRLFGINPFKRHTLYFGGGEVLCDERPIPHDGRNLPLLFFRSIQKKRFVLLGGITSPHRRLTKQLYRYILPKAQDIVVRDSQSQTIVHHYTAKEAQNRGDFAQIIMQNLLPLASKKTYTTKPYILVNMNTANYNDQNLYHIKTFCNHYKDHEIYFYPCDMKDDPKCFNSLKHILPNIKYYDWTNHTLDESLSLFAHAKAGIGSRLHFLLPLKTYKKPFQAIFSAEKIQKVILND